MGEPVFHDVDPELNFDVEPRRLVELIRLKTELRKLRVVGLPVVLRLGQGKDDGEHAVDFRELVGLQPTDGTLFEPRDVNACHCGQYDDLIRIARLPAVPQSHLERLRRHQLRRATFSSSSCVTANITDVDTVTAFTSIAAEPALPRHVFV